MNGVVCAASTPFSAQKNVLQRATRLGVLVAAASCLQLLEAPLPRLFPWLKPGLANALVLFAIFRGSLLDGLLIAVGRGFLSGMFLGTLFSPAHLLSLAGGTAAALSMSVAYTCTGRKSVSLGVVGISVIGAITNNMAQLWVVGRMFGGTFPLVLHFSLMLWLAIPAGLAVAWLTAELLRRVA